MKFSQCVEMSITRADFLRLLPAAVNHAPFSVAGERIAHHGAGRSWNIRLTALPDLRIGLVRLERHRVLLSLDGYGEEEAAAFMRRFELYFRRGGG
ncbi:hypothetical protein GALL_108020 [mine drainage metagenome]|uniref:Uncharacterized protein n=1 Tax=mine drainage metagenome TaxID=410659 RepID=A0A1J5ST56_9ZZZZ